MIKYICAISIVLLSFAGNTQNWSEIAKIAAPDRSIEDLFGHSVAISGGFAIVGASKEDEDENGVNTIWNAGSAYILELDSVGSWTQTQKLVASDRAESDWFGGDVSIDGNLAIVSARLGDTDEFGNNYLNDAGAVYIYEQDSTGYWSQTQKLVSSDREANDYFGKSVAIKGNYAVVGAYWEDEDTANLDSLYQAGSVYVFYRDSTGTWNESQKLVSSDREANDSFGMSVDIDGDYIIVGSVMEDEDAFGSNTMSGSGSAYIFKVDGNGIWSETQKIVALDRDVGDAFGATVSISENHVVVGAYLEDHDEFGANIEDNAGSAYVFELNGSGVWDQVQKIVSSDRSPLDYFGFSVAIDQRTIIVGASSEDEDSIGNNTLNNAGSAYIFEQNGVGSWNEVDKIVNSDREVGDAFAYSVDVDGTYAISSAHAEDEDELGANTMNSSGSVYIFQRYVSTAIVENLINQEYLVFPNPTNGSFSVDLGENYNNARITLTDLRGKVIWSRFYYERPFITFMLQEPAGVYLLTIESNNKNAVIRLIKE